MEFHMNRTKGRTVQPSAGFAILAIALLIGLNIYLSPLEPNIFHLQFSFSEQSFKTVLSKWHLDGVDRYQSHLPTDFLFLAVYGLCGWRFGRERTRELAKQPELRTTLTWALPLAAVADAAENSIHIILTDPSASVGPAVYLLSGATSSFKWLAAMSFFVSCGLFYWWRRAPRQTQEIRRPPTRDEDSQSS